MNIKTYSSKSNAKRAAIAAHGSTLNLALKGKEGAWYYAEVNSMPSPAKATEPAPEVKAMFAKLDAAKERLSTPAKKEAATKAPPKAPKAPKAKKEGTYAQMQASRQTSSSVENPVRAMWDMCDSMTGSKRKDVIAAAVAAGINYYTARTQYQLWLTAWRNSQTK